MGVAGCGKSTVGGLLAAHLGDDRLPWLARTTYSPLAHRDDGPGTRVAVVGMGGPGHMAVKIAAAMGADVTVLSRTVAKKDDGLAFGATDYYATDDAATFEALAHRINDAFERVLSSDVRYRYVIDTATL